jgi:hypothetical protein
MLYYLIQLFSLRRKTWAHRTSLATPHFIEIESESERAGLCCVRGLH